MRKIALAVTLALALTGCIADNFDSRKDPKPITFATQIDPQTRAQGTSWDAEDEIGIYMLHAGQSMTDNSIAANVKHIHAGNGEFSAGNTSLFYPENGAAVDFVAYYPWSGELDGHTYPIDVSDQTAPSEIDFMYSNNATNLSGGVPFLEFNHALTRLTFSITGADENIVLENVGATITGLKTVGEFDLADGSFEATPGTENEIEPLVTVGEVEGTTHATISAIVLPQNDLSFKLNILFADGQSAVVDFSGVSYRSGYAYTYNIEVNEQSEAVIIGGSEINDWENGGGGDRNVDKGDVETFYRETFGTKNYGSTKPTIDDFVDWSSGVSGVNYENLGDADVVVRSSSSSLNDPYMMFPATGMSNVVISGLPTGYSGVVFSCTIACPDGATTNPVRFYASSGDLENMGEVTPAGVALSTAFVEVSMNVPAGTTTMRLTSSGAGIAIDNITLRGIRQ